MRIFDEFRRLEGALIPLRDLLLELHFIDKLILSLDRLLDGLALFTLHQFFADRIYFRLEGALHHLLFLENLFDLFSLAHQFFFVHVVVSLEEIFESFNIYKFFVLLVLAVLR